MANTEKPTGKAEQKRQGIVATPKKQEVNQTPINKPKEEKQEEKKIEKPVEKKKETKPKIHKTMAMVHGKDLHISTKYSVGMCKFIKRKKIEKAIEDLEKVLFNKKVIPMKGEIAHKKGKGIMSGKYPQKATKEFIRLLKSLLANSNVNGLDNPIISEAIPNMASRPMGRFGSVQRKRTHVKIVAKEKKITKKTKEKKK
jgi:ribosomal protein L22